MIELFIDGQPAELATGCPVELSASLERITDPANAQPQVYRLTLPMSARNRTVLGFAGQGPSVQRFDHREHSGRIVCRGAVLAQGYIAIDSCHADTAGAGSYHIRLVVPPPAWVGSAAATPLSRTAIRYTALLDEHTIRRSWSDGQAVKFLPVKRDAEPAYGQERVILGGLRYDNYHPFVQVRALLEAIVGQAGYRIRSRFMDGPFFGSLYMSGLYAGLPAGEDPSRMDFTARRTAADRSAVGDSEGRVFAAAPSQTVPEAHSVGWPVDTADTREGDPCYGQGFRMVDGRPAFVPERDVVAGFGFRLNVRFTPQLLSPFEVRGVGRIGWDGQLLHDPAPLPNPLTDRKNGGGAGRYRIVSFDGQTATRRVVVHYKQGGKGVFPFGADGQTANCSYEFSHAVCQVYLNGEYTPVADPDCWALYTEAEYLSYTTPEGESTLDLTSAPGLYVGGEAVFFDTLWFQVPPGGGLTLCRGTTVRPVFYPMPGAGAPLAFASVFAHQNTQLELIRALAHLFGLHFYTDDDTRTILIEPRSLFLGDTPIDWSHKIDPRRGVVWRGMGDGLYRRRTLAYRPGDAAVRRADAGTGSSFGRWSADTGLPLALPGERVVPNPLFTATRDERHSLASAPDASMIVVGDRAAPKGTSGFPAKIVRYFGLLPLPDGQSWGWPAPGREYPAVGFSAGLDGHTLCFDDQGGQAGLKHYHLPQHELAEKGRLLTLSLRLSPSDMEAVLSPGSTGRDFRGDFVFRLRGERFHARLVEISGYDPAGGAPARCTFTVGP